MSRGVAEAARTTFRSLRIPNSRLFFCSVAIERGHAGAEVIDDGSHWDAGDGALDVSTSL